MPSLCALLLLAQTPALDADGTARAYLQALRQADFERASTLVEGGTYSASARRLGELLREAGAKGARPLIVPIEIKTQTTGDTATADVRLGTFREEERARLNMVRRAEGWRIVPSAPDLTAPKLLDGITFGFVQPMVFAAIVAPIEAQKAKAEARVADLKAMKGLAFALLMWSDDHDDLLPRPSLDLTLTLKGYVKDKALLDRLRLKDGVRWRLNPFLAGKSLIDVNELSRTVVLYEEIGGKPAPRSEGGQLVALADGSVRFVAPDMAKALLWTLPKPTPGVRRFCKSSRRSRRFLASRLL